MWPAGEMGSAERYLCNRISFYTNGSGNSGYLFKSVKLGLGVIFVHVVTYFVNR